jgi:hypothetical protein
MQCNEKCKNMFPLYLPEGYIDLSGIRFNFFRLFYLCCSRVKHPAGTAALFRL